MRTARTFPVSPSMHCSGVPAQVPPLWTEWQTGVKIITLPQTSFAGGNMFCN